VGVHVSAWSEEELGTLSLISMPRRTETRQSDEAAFPCVHHERLQPPL
jgi:hypothetical protein